MHAEHNAKRLPLHLAELLRQLRPDVIHARNWGAWPDIVIASLLVQPAAPLIWSFHGLDDARSMTMRRRSFPDCWQ